jgi:hypothetical protein
LDKIADGMLNDVMDEDDSIADDEEGNGQDLGGDSNLHGGLALANKKRKRKKLTPKVIENLARNLRQISTYQNLAASQPGALTSIQRKKYQPWYNTGLSDEIVKVRPTIENRLLAEERVKAANRKSQNLN